MAEQNFDLKRRIIAHKLPKEMGEFLTRKIDANDGEFSETLQIRSDGSFQLVDEHGKPKSYFPHMSAGYYRGGSETERLYNLAQRVQREFPKLDFSFVRDKEGKSITYKVAKRSKDGELA